MVDGADGEEDGHNSDGQDAPEPAPALPRRLSLLGGSIPASRRVLLAGRLVRTLGAHNIHARRRPRSVVTASSLGARGVSLQVGALWAPVTSVRDRFRARRGGSRPSGPTGALTRARPRRVRAPRMAPAGAPRGDASAAAPATRMVARAFLGAPTSAHAALRPDLHLPAAPALGAAGGRRALPRYAVGPSADETPGLDVAPLRRHRLPRGPDRGADLRLHRRRHRREDRARR